MFIIFFTVHNTPVGIYLKTLTLHLKMLHKMDLIKAKGIVILSILEMFVCTKVIPTSLPMLTSCEHGGK